MKSDYPLEPLRRGRRAELDAARRQLADARRNVERSRALIQHCEGQLAHHAAETAETVREVRVDDGLRGEELTRLAGYERRRRVEAARLGAGIVEAKEASSRAERALTDAQRSVARAQASHDGVVRHRARWIAEAERRAADLADEEAAEARREARPPLAGDPPLEPGAG